MSRLLLASGCAAAIAAVAAVLAGGGDEPARDPVVVRVELEGATSAAEVATGFVAGPGRVVTVAHVLDPDRRILVGVTGRLPVLGRVLSVSRSDDLALIAAPGIVAEEGHDGGAEAVPMHPRSGAGPVRILVRRGNRPSPLRARIRRPIRATVRGPGAAPYRRRALELDARVRLGDSGAAVVDADGRVVGVLFARASSGAATAYAVDASAVQALLFS